MRVGIVSKVIARYFPLRDKDVHYDLADKLNHIAVGLAPLSYNVDLALNLQISTAGIIQNLRINAIYQEQKHLSLVSPFCQNVRENNG